MKGDRTVRYAVVGLTLTLFLVALANVRTTTALNAYASGGEQLTWRQATIIKTRAKTHACQDELGVHRSPVAQRVITGGPAYRAWVLYRWRYRLRFCRDVLEQLNADPVKAILTVWGPHHGPKAVEVARCETGGTFSVYESNGQYLGLFQMGEWARGRYGHSYTPLGQARAAYRNFRENGWSQWACA
jgi:hypothetical protein